MFKKILAGAFAFLLFSSVCIAAEDSNITISEDAHDNKYYKEVVWFSAYDVGGDAGTTYKYNEVEGTSDSSGLVEVRRYNLKKTIQIDLITLGSTSVEVRVEGRAGSSAEWGEIATVSFATETGANNSHMVNVVEFLEEIRVGVKATSAGTDSITVSGIMLGDSR